MKPDSLHPVWLSLGDLLVLCELQFKRASGPGGQNRNKVETGVILTHKASGVQGEATERRTQGENKSVAVSRLRVMLAIQLRTEPAVPFDALIQKYRSKSGKIAISAGNWDWPIVLAETLNWLAHYEWDVSSTAEKLQTTTSQVLKLLKQAPQAFRTLNQKRGSLGLSTFKP